MTERERIIQEGILPASFFRPETFCDFYVSEKRKMIWGILLDLLIKFDKICRKYNLRYSLFFGALLGAIRHKGFIPWDDDIDVVMSRKDYVKFCDLARKEITPPLLCNCLVKTMIIGILLQN